MFIDGEQQPVGPGHTIYIAPHARQCIKNTGSDDLVFLCIVDPAWKIEDEEVLELKNRDATPEAVIRLFKPHLNHRVP